MEKSAVKEQMPVSVMEKLLNGSGKVRVALAPHPITGEIAPCVPYRDYSDLFSYEESAIRHMIDRTPWLKKHSIQVIMSGVDGKFRGHLCIFEEAMLGLFMKLQPKRCKNPEVATKIDEIQEKLILVLKETIKGYRPNPGFCDEKEGLLPRPGTSMITVSKLCSQAHSGNRFAVRALEYFYGMPVGDLLDDLFDADPNISERAGLISLYLKMMLSGKYEGVKSDGTAVEGFSRDFYRAAVEISQKRGLSKFFTNPMSFGRCLLLERDALEALGWRKERVKTIHGSAVYRFNHVVEAQETAPTPVEAVV